MIAWCSVWGAWGVKAAFTLVKDRQRWNGLQRALNGRQTQEKQRQRAAGRRKLVWPKDMARQPLQSHFEWIWMIRFHYSSKKGRENERFCLSHNELNLSDMYWGWDFWETGYNFSLSRGGRSGSVWVEMLHLNCHLQGKLSRHTWCRRKPIYLMISMQKFMWRIHV